MCTAHGPQDTVICGLPSKTYSKTAHFREKVTEHKMPDFLCNFCLQHISFQETFSKILPQMYCIGLHVTFPLFLSDFNHTLILSMDFRKILKYQISWKSVWWELSCSMQRDGHDEDNSCFPQTTMNKKTFLPGTNMKTPGTLKNCVKMTIINHAFLSA